MEARRSCRSVENPAIAWRPGAEQTNQHGRTREGWHRPGSLERVFLRDCQYFRHIIDTTEKAAPQGHRLRGEGPRGTRRDGNLFEPLPERFVDNFFKAGFAAFPGAADKAATSSSRVSVVRMHHIIMPLMP